MAIVHSHIRPSWPTRVLDLDIVRVSYDVPADEFLVHFGGKSAPATSSVLKAPGFEATAIMIGLDPDGDETGEIVGIHVIPMMLEAVPVRPEWSILTWAVLAGEYGTELLQERLPLFIEEVAEAFEKYWKPAPPIEEQLAAMRQANQTRQSA